MVKIKVCGMQDPTNILSISALQPDYMGFIFYKYSKRNFTGELPKIPSAIQKVGVFVDEELDVVIDTIQKYQLDVVQLHGKESVPYCTSLREKMTKSASRLKNDIKIWKVFSVFDGFDFSVLEPFEAIVSCFLFDTLGKHRGGNGIPFDWNILKKYPRKYINTPIVLSGGIGMEQLASLKKLLNSSIPIQTVDINSRFETQAGIKNIPLVHAFLKSIRSE